jgi:hypothetical protein
MVPVDRSTKSKLTSPRSDSSLNIQYNVHSIHIPTPPTSLLLPMASVSTSIDPSWIERYTNSYKWRTDMGPFSWFFDWLGKELGAIGQVRVGWFFK